MATAHLDWSHNIAMVPWCFYNHMQKSNKAERLNTSYDLCILTLLRCKQQFLRGMHVGGAQGCIKLVVAQISGNPIPHSLRSVIANMEVLLLHKHGVHESLKTEMNMWSIQQNRNVTHRWVSFGRLTKKSGTLPLKEFWLRSLHATFTGGNEHCIDHTSLNDKLLLKTTSEQNKMSAKIKLNAHVHLKTASSSLQKIFFWRF